MFEFDLLAVVDGGSRGNGPANEGYGSYVLSTRDGRKETMRLDLGTATKTEAEYQTLIAALKDLSGRIQQAGESPSRYSLLIHTSSQLMVGQLTQGWQVKAASLRPLVDEAKNLILFTGSGSSFLFHKLISHNRFEARSRAQAVAPAIRQGLLPGQDSPEEEESSSAAPLMWIVIHFSWVWPCHTRTLPRWGAWQVRNTLPEPKSSMEVKHVPSNYTHRFRRPGAPDALQPNGPPIPQDACPSPEP